MLIAGVTSLPLVSFSTILCVCVCVCVCVERVVRVLLLDLVCSAFLSVCCETFPCVCWEIQVFFYCGANYCVCIDVKINSIFVLDHSLWLINHELECLVRINKMAHSLGASPIVA